MSVGGSPNRRHSNSRSTHGHPHTRHWDDWRWDWPLQFIILPVLVAFAFCLVLFLGSKHGTKLAAMRTWFPSGPAACKSFSCAKAVAVDSDGAVVAGLGPADSGVAGGGGLAAGGGLGGALSGLSGLLGLESSRGSQSSVPQAQNDLGLMALEPADAAKFDFPHWLAEAEKLAGVQSRDCDASYGLPYIEQWRKGRLEWCGADGAAEAEGSLSSPSSSASSALGGTATDAKAAASVLGRGLAEAKAAAGSTGSLAAGGLGSKNGSAAAATTAVGGKPAAAATVATAAKALGSASGSGSGAAAAAAAAASSAVHSSVSLYPFKDKESFLMFATAKNTVLDTKAFLGSLPALMPEARRGTYRAACKVSKTSLAADFLKVEATKRWISGALKGDEQANVSAACASSAASAASQNRATGPVMHPVMLLSRMDSTSAFRTVEEAVTTFVSLAVLNDPQISKQGLQVVIADGKPDGFYLDLWTTLSKPYPLRILSTTPWAPNTCLTQALHNGFSGASILTSMGAAKRTTCRSTVVIAAALWLRHLLAPAIQPVAKSSYSSVQNRAVVRKSVVWISRRNFEGLAQSNLTPWQDQRRFSNEGEVVLELQREVWRWNDEACLRSGLTKSFGSRQQPQLRRRSRQLRRLAAALRGGSGAAEGWQHDVDTAGGAGVTADGNAGAGAGADGGLLTSGSSSSRRLRGGSRCRQSNVFFDLRVVELNDLPFYPDALQVLGQATILAGAHGTGLANMVFMPPTKCGVLELHHNSAGNDQYHNMAHLLGHKYVAVESDGDRVDLPEAAEGLRKLLDMLGSG